MITTIFRINITLFEYYVAISLSIRKNVYVKPFTVKCQFVFFSTGISDSVLELSRLPVIRFSTDFLFEVDFVPKNIIKLSYYQFIVRFKIERLETIAKQLVVLLRACRSKLRIQKPPGVLDHLYRFLL